MESRYGILAPSAMSDKNDPKGDTEHLQFGRISRFLRLFLVIHDPAKSRPFPFLVTWLI